MRSTTNKTIMVSLRRKGLYPQTLSHLGHTIQTNLSSFEKRKTDIAVYDEPPVTTDTQLVARALRSQHQQFECSRVPAQRCQGMLPVIYPARRHVLQGVFDIDPADNAEERGTFDFLWGFTRQTSPHSPTCLKGLQYNKICASWRDILCRIDLSINDHSSLIPLHPTEIA